jgi:hypothetical protein
MTAAVLNLMPKLFRGKDVAAETHNESKLTKMNRNEVALVKLIMILYRAAMFVALSETRNRLILWFW